MGVPDGAFLYFICKVTRFFSFLFIISLRIEDESTKKS